MTRRARLNSDLFDEIIVDNFAGGGGASMGIESALGRSVDISINHDPEAIAMHRVNHPHTRHLCESVWDVDPVEVTGGRPIGLAWFSPDCKHFSKAKGGKPVSKRIRGLAWIVIRWAELTRPRVIILENVEEFQTWGPLGADDRPCPRRKGQTFRRWVDELRKRGYAVEWRELRACDYGVPTIRKRFFLIARCDGQPIVWPEPTHGAGRRPYRTAAECIDWSIPCPSIFERKKPLAENTLRRIAAGIRRYVIETAEPFIVTCNHGGAGFRGQSIDDPMRTVTAARDAHGLVVPVITRGQHGGGNRPGSAPMHTVTASRKDQNAIIAPVLVRNYHGEKTADAVEEPLRTVTTQGNKFSVVTPFLVPRYGERDGQEPRSRSIDDPAPTVVPTANGANLVAAFLAKHNGKTTGQPLEEPLHTIAGNINKAVVASHLVKLRGTCRDGQDVREPMPTVTAGGFHVGEVRAFLVKYYGNERDGASVREPMPTVTARDRLGLVTVAGEEFVIVDIGMRMLQPRELYRAQGFPNDYVIEHGVNADGERIRLTKTAQVRMCGNSVCPPLAAVLVRANVSARAQESTCA